MTVSTCAVSGIAKDSPRTWREYWSALNSPRTCAALLLLFLAIASLSAELAARYIFPKISRIRQRIETERDAARQLKGEPQRPAILVVGNSLVERGVDIDSLRAQLIEYKVARFVVSDTSYFDWYYGLRRLFSEGARPQIVVLGLSARQLLTNRIEGNLSANVLIRTADIHRVARDLEQDNTATSNLYFDNLSAFFGGSTQFRKWLLASEIMPDLQNLAVALSPPIRPLVPSSEIISIGGARLRAINEVCRESGVRFLLVVPPSPSLAEAQFDTLKQAGSQFGVDVLTPAEKERFTADLFSDGLHLNRVGEGKFTLLLASSLKEKLSDRMNAKLF
jgi:hypothetical protein